MFRGLFINLDRDRDRLKHMEAEFQRFGLSEHYQRLPAVAHKQGAVGCLRSHLLALDFARRQDAFVHILEDDTILSADLGAFLGSSRLSGLMERYDILFLDMWVDPMASVVERFQAALRRPGPMDLKGTRVGTAASYVVSPRSAGLLLALVRDAKPAIDSRYGDLVQSGAINAAVMVPFLTGMDINVAAASSIQTVPAKVKRRYIMLRTAFFADQERQPAWGPRRGRG